MQYRKDDFRKAKQLEREGITKLGKWFQFAEEDLECFVCKYHAKDPDELYTHVINTREHRNNVDIYLLRKDQ